MLSLIVGLGNPGPEYAFNRHNLGFMLVDVLAHQGGGTFHQKNQSLMAHVTLNQAKIALMKPLTYMNRSGIAVREYASFYKIDPSHILVIHDDLTLPFLKVRVKQGGGTGGHNGLKSIDSTLGQNYWRLRVGIDHPGGPHVTQHVLGNFSSQEKEQLPSFFSLFLENFALLMNESSDAFQSKMSLMK